MTPEQRINELTKRQIWYGSSLVVKLNAINGKWFYSVYAWYSMEGKSDCKFAVLFNKYNGEDPIDLIQVALFELGIKKIKLGVPQTKGGKGL